MRPISLVNSSDSGDRTPGRAGDAMDRRLGSTVGIVCGDECVELGVDSLDGGDGDLYALLRGASLYWASPDMRVGYMEPDFNDGMAEDDAADEGVSLAGGPRCMPFVSLGSTGSGRLVPESGWGVPGTVFSGTMGRICLLK